MNNQATTQVLRRSKLMLVITAFLMSCTLLFAPFSASAAPVTIGNFPSSSVGTFTNVQACKIYSSINVTVRATATASISSSRLTWNEFGLALLPAGSNMYTKHISSASWRSNKITLSVTGPRTDTAMIQMGKVDGVKFHFATLLQKYSYNNDLKRVAPAKLPNC